MVTGNLRRAWIVVAVAAAWGCGPAPVDAPPARRPAPAVATAAPVVASAPAPSESPSASVAPTASAEAPAPPEVPIQPPPPAQAADTKGMVLLPGGTYATAGHKKKVTLTAFWLDVAEVTAGAYEACVKAGKCTEDGLLCEDAHTYRVASKKSYPVNCVDQGQAIAYCAYVGKRLPVAEEWEWAARGTTRGWTYPWGDKEPSKQLCWKRYDYKEVYVRKWHCPDGPKGECFQSTDVEGRRRIDGPCPVRSYPAGNSPEGIADLLGNVEEWTTSWKSKTAVSTCGGSWTLSYESISADSSSGGAGPTTHSDRFGFRCAWTALTPAAAPQPE